MTGGYLIFTILGYLLATTDFSKKQRASFYVLAICSALFRYFGTIYLSNKAGLLDRTFFNYMQFHSVFLACGVFIFFKQISWDRIFRAPAHIKMQLWHLSNSHCCPVLWTKSNKLDSWSTDLSNCRLFYHLWCGTCHYIYCKENSYHKKTNSIKKEGRIAPFNLSLKPNTYHTSHTDHLM